MTDRLIFCPQGIPGIRGEAGLKGQRGLRGDPVSAKIFSLSLDGWIINLNHSYMYNHTDFLCNELVSILCQRDTSQNKLLVTERCERFNAAQQYEAPSLQLQSK